MTEPCRFFVPGPSWVRPEILAELNHPMIGHRTPEFKALCSDVFTDLKSLFHTNQQAFVATASGTGLLEGALLNCVPKRVLVTTCGAFSERWRDIAQNLGVEVDVLEHAWGEPVDPERLATHFAGRRRHYDAVTITHNETSTGVTSDLETLARVVRTESDDTLILVDAVSSLGAIPVLFDEWGLDVCLASSQKGLALPPGLTVFAVSDRALAAAARRHYRGTYFDFLEYDKRAREGSVPFTPCVPLYYAMHRQLGDILRTETLEKRWARHRIMRDRTLERTASYARPMARIDHASASVSTLSPLQVEAASVLASMKSRGFTLASGYGDWKADGIRIGHMGDMSIGDLDAMLDALEECATNPA